jgi:hypothetical protein
LANEKKQHEQVEKYLKQEKIAYQAYLLEPKLLILGSADSGKSTLLKQLKLCYGSGFTEEERFTGRQVVQETIWKTCKQILTCIDSLDSKFDKLKEKEDIRQSIDNQELELMKELWNLDVVKNQLITIQLLDTAS